MARIMRVPVVGVATVGDIKYSVASANHGNWLIFNGQAVSRTTYADLFALIGVSFGIGDGVDTFNLPDARGRVLGAIGQGANLTNRVMGAVVGAETHTLTVDQMPAHTHSVETLQTASQNAWAGGDVRANSTTKNTSAVGGNGAHNNMQPTLFIANVFIYSGASV